MEALIGADSSLMSLSLSLSLSNTALSRSSVLSIVGTDTISHAPVFAKCQLDTGGPPYCLASLNLLLVV